MGIDGKPYNEEFEAGWIRQNPNVVAVRKNFYADARALYADLEAKFRDDPGVFFADASSALSGERGRVYIDSRQLIGAGNDVVACKIVRRLQTCQLLPVKLLR